MNTGSPTPKADQQITECFRRAKHMTRAWFCFFIFFVIACICCGIWFQKKNHSEGMKIATILSVSLSTGTAGIGYALNISNYFGLRGACNCLKTCSDLKTKEFLNIVKKMKLLLILDTLIPPLKAITTPYYYKYSYQLKGMVDGLENKKKY